METTHVRQITWIEDIDDITISTPNSYSVEATAADKTLFAEDDGSSGPAMDIAPSGQASRFVHSTTDFIGDAEGVSRMLQVLSEHISDSNQ